MSQLLEHVNGTHARGRTPPALQQFTFKDGNVTIGIRKVGPTTQQQLARQIMKDYPEPVVPTVETELGLEPNAADPAYLLAKAAWDTQTNNEMNTRMLLIAALEAEAEIDEQARQDIKRKQRHMQLIGIPYEPNPDLTDAENEKVFYILHVAAATPDDLREFGDAVLRRSVPTEEAVQAQITTFQRDLSE